MKRLAIALVSGIVMVAAATSAHALSVSADFPLQYTYNNANQSADSVSGIKLGVKLPILVGLGLETYTVTTDANAATSAPEYNLGVQFLDFFYELPIPIINIAAGLGIGTLSFEDGSGVTTYNNGLATQYFVSMGYSFIPLIDLHLGYHVVKGSVEEKTSKEKTDMGGTMLSLGLRIGF